MNNANAIHRGLTRTPAAMFAGNSLELVLLPSSAPLWIAAKIHQTGRPGWLAAVPEHERAWVELDVDGWAAWASPRRGAELAITTAGLRAVLTRTAPGLIQVIEHAPGLWSRSPALERLAGASPALAAARLAAIAARVELDQAELERLAAARVERQEQRERAKIAAASRPPSPRSRKVRASDRHGSNPRGAPPNPAAIAAEIPAHA